MNEDTIDSFTDEYRFLSNFWVCEVVHEGITYNSSEAAYQAAKTLDMSKREEFKHLKPGQSKRAGKILDLRADWQDVKLRVMYDIVLDKFTRNTDLRKKLIDTNDAFLIEGNTWGDTFWGMCDGKGKNYLGIILMNIRSELR